MSIRILRCKKLTESIFRSEQDADPANLDGYFIDRIHCFYKVIAIFSFYSSSREKNHSFV